MANQKNIEINKTKMKSVKKAKASFAYFSDDLFPGGVHESFNGLHFLVYPSGKALATS